MFVKIPVSASALRRAGLSRLTKYRRHVVESGHVPGVLSGAELRGRAKFYGASYARSRRAVFDALERAYGIRVGTAVHNAKVWVDAADRRVVLFFVN